MLKTNKIVSLILVVVMALSMFVIPASALDGEKNEIIVDGISYPVIVGETYTYTFVLNVSDITAHTSKPGYLMNMEASTYYDDSKLEIQNYDDPDVVDIDDEGEDMFPVIWTKGYIANKLDDEITYNASAVPKGIKFNSDESVLFKGVFKVIAEGSSEINTFIKNSQNIDLEIVIERGEFKGDAWKTIETLTGNFAPDDPTEPAPTEPAPTEPEPTEPEPTEPEPTEPFNPADHTWTAVGAIAPGHVDGGMLGTAWGITNTDNDLVFDEATGLWSKTYTDVAATGETEDYDDTWYEYKVAADHDWALSFNDTGDALGDGTNAKFDVEVDGSTVTIFFDGTKCWAEVKAPELPTEPEPTEPAPTEPAPTEPEPTEPEPTEPEPTEPFNPADHTWTAVGAIAPGHVDGGMLGTAWNVTNTDNDLVFDEATGLWSKTYTDVAATGETDDYDDTWYEYKVAADHDWALSFNDTGDALGDGTNAKFDVEVDGSTVTIFFDGTKCWAEVKAPELPTEPEPTEPAPTETQPESKELFVRVDGQLYPVVKGQKYVYEYYLTVPEAIRSFDATTWYDADGLQVVPALDADGEEDYSVMFPNFPSGTIANITGIEGEILYNFSHLKGVDFSEEKVAFTVEFLVTAEEGIYDISSQVTTMGDINGNIYVDHCQTLIDTWSDREVFDGKSAPTEPKPTEPAPTEPAPTEPAPTEPAPTEPAPTEPAPTEPAPTEPAPTEPAPKTYIKTENGYYEVEKGQTYTYIYYLASDAKISSLDATTYYDTTGLKFIPAEEDIDMFPVLKSVVSNMGVDGQVIYNYSNYKGVSFPIPADGVTFTEENAVFVGQFEVIGEPGVYEINTALKVLGGAPNVKIIYNFEKVNDEVTVMTNGVIDGYDPVDDDVIPTEPTEPEPTEPEPTEPAPTEPEPTEPAPTEPAPTKPTETTGSTDNTDATEKGTSPSAAKPTTSSTASQNKTNNTSSVKTGSTETAIAFITVLVMAAGVVMFARKKKFD